VGLKSEHVALPALYDLVCGVAGMDAQGLSHIEACEQCRTDLNWMQQFAGFAAREKHYEPPSWVLANARNVFKLKRPGAVTIAKEIVAKLIYDSFNEPLPAGVRKRDLPARQTLYATDRLQLDLKVEVGDDKGQIIGQIVVEKGNMDVSGIRVDLTEHGRVIDKSTTNSLGEFVFDDLPEGNYELQIALADTLIKLPSLPPSN